MLFLIVDLKNFSWCNVIQQMKKTGCHLKSVEIIF